MRDVIVDSDPNSLAFLESKFRPWTGAINHQYMFQRHARLLAFLFGYPENCIWYEVLVVNDGRYSFEQVQNEKKPVCREKSRGAHLCSKRLNPGPISLENI
jgi:hypothetical protein